MGSRQICVLISLGMLVLFWTPVSPFDELYQLIHPEDGYHYEDHDHYEYSHGHSYPYENDPYSPVYHSSSGYHRPYVNYSHDIYREMHPEEEEFYKGYTFEGNDPYVIASVEEYLKNMEDEQEEEKEENETADVDEGLVEYLQEVVEKSPPDGYVGDAPYIPAQPNTNEHRPEGGHSLPSVATPYYGPDDGHDHYFDYPRIGYDSSQYPICDGDYYVRCIDSKFRSLDGSCNNLQYPTWGKSQTCIPRLIRPPAYADGVSAPRASVTGEPLPSARLVTSYLHPDVQAYTYVTGIFMQWGQVIGHEIALTPTAEIGHKPFKCCPKPENPECFPIHVPHDDYFFKHLEKNCLKVVRSKTCDLCNTPYREQINDATSYIDASLVYGNTQNESLSLREFKGGRLLISVSNYGSPLLPHSTSPFTDHCSKPEENHFCYRSGDRRVNQHPMLTVLHTILLRQHNRIAYALESLNPYWNDQRIYQETRRIVGAQMQAVTYKEFLPYFIGREYTNYFGLDVLQSGFTEYNPYLLAAVFAETSTNAMRVGHTLIYSDITEVLPDGHHKMIRLRDYFFHPFDIAEGQLDPLLKGMVKSPSQSYDPYFTTDIKNHLGQKRGKPSGGDLPSINIQRARDHGVHGYTSYLRLCFNKTIYSFEELDQLMPQEQRIKYQYIYRSVDDIDLYSGGVSERNLPGALVGPTFACILGLQFHQLKFGDRYYFEHGYQAGSFSKEQLQSIRETTLAKIICANADYIPQVQRNIFMLESESNPVVNCNDIPDVNLDLWKEPY